MPTGTSNSESTLRKFVGHTLVGVLVNDNGSITMVFDDGTGLAFTGSIGSVLGPAAPKYGTISKADLKRQLDKRASKLEKDVGDRQLELTHLRQIISKSPKSEEADKSQEPTKAKSKSKKKAGKK